MEKKVLLKKLVEEGRHIRKEFTPTAIVSDYGSRPIGEFWDANKTVDVIVNGAHAVHDTVRELDEFTEALITRLNNVKVGRIGNDETISDIKALTNAQIDKLKVGDTVIKGEHSYTVAYKSPTEMSLVYSDVLTTEEVYYEKHDGNWAHVVTDSIAPQEKLVSGQNIKTVASQSLVGEGDVPLKTIANQSIIGSGNIDIQIPTVPDNISYFNNDAGYLKNYIEVVPDLGHDYVDLGLPSGTLWATANVGASNETGYGNFYMYGSGSSQYNSTDSYYSGTEDPLSSSVDTATQVWGNSWYMPTQDLFNELISNTTYTWESNFNNSGISGGKFTSTNGNYIFLPAHGYMSRGTQSNEGTTGIYWTSTPAGAGGAYSLRFADLSKYVQSNPRSGGYSIRPVHDTPQLVQVSTYTVTQAEKTAWDAKIDSTTFNALEARVAALELAAGINQQSNPE